jgi:multidrug efflux pump subunit AcrA (membrane-fusion protein)
MTSSVRVATIKASPVVMSVTLPATTAAFAQAEIYARATGYIGKRYVDIGDRVRLGELLAELAVPEHDDTISQNEATRNQLQAALEEARANLKLAQVTWDRDRPLVSEGWATPQQGTIDVQTLKADEAAVSVARANVAAQEKLLMTLHQNRDYASVTAPFNGVITQCNVDVRHFGAGQRQHWHVHVRGHAEGRDPRLCLRASGCRLWRGARR